VTSQIDTTKPIFGSPTTQSVRDNFTTAANEISTLQDQTSGSPFLPLAGGRMTGAIYLFNDPTDAMMPATKGYVDASSGGGGGGGIPEAPSDGQAYGRNNGAWQAVLPIVGGTLTGPLVLAADPTTALGAVTKQYADAIGASHIVDAPNDANTYGRHANAWAGVLPITGGRVTGTTSVGPAIPANASATPALFATYANLVGQGSFNVNAYLDNGTTPAWRYASAGPAITIATAGSNAAIYVLPSGAAGAPITFGPSLQIDYKGNVIVAGGATIPTDTLNPIASAVEFVASGHFSFNGYVPTPGTGWKYLQAGYFASIWVSSAGSLTINLAPSGAAGGNIPAQLSFSFDQAGRFTAPGSLVGNGQCVMAQQSAGNGFIGSYHVSNGTAVGFWNDSNTIYFGNSDGNGVPSLARGSWSTDAFNVTGDIVASVGVYAAGQRGAYGFWAGSNGVTRFFQFAPSWYWAWDTSSGTIAWNCPDGSLLVMRQGPDHLIYNAVGGVAGYGPYSDLSDERAKQAVSSATVGLAELLQLEPINFTRIAHQPKDEDVSPLGDTVTHPPEIGFSAQQVKAIIPEAVSVVGLILPDGSGGLDTDNPSLGVVATAILAAAVNAIKDIDARLRAGGL
jgi:hypothetical protein